MNGQFIERDGKAVPCDDLMEWARWLETADRKVADTIIGEVHVSTVFLGLDQSFGEGPPLLYETMIFEGAHDGYQDRYSTRAEALAGHQRAVDLLVSNKPKS